MASPFSDDLRRKLLDDYQRGQCGLEKLAAAYGVSYGWAQKVVATHRRTGCAERPKGGKRGFPSRLTPQIKDRIRIRLSKYPNSTLRELQQWLMKTQSVAVGLPHLCTTLKNMGLRQQKRAHCGSDY